MTRIWPTTSNPTAIVFGVLSFVLIQNLLSHHDFSVEAKPYGGWGPGEGFGHTGNTFPAPNPNAIYGYDFHNLFDNWTTYGSRYNQHRVNRTNNSYRNRRPKNLGGRSTNLIHATSFDDHKTGQRLLKEKDRYETQSEFKNIFRYF